MENENERDLEKAQYRRVWHLEKSVPLATILALMLQTAAVIWWASATNARLEYIEKGTISTQISQASIDRRQDDEALRSEARMIVTLDKLNQKLDRLIEARK